MALAYRRTGTTGLGMKRYESWVVALLFSAMVLAIFYVLQDFGPESTLRKFHQRLSDNDMPGTFLYIEQPVDDPATKLLVSDINNLLSVGATPTVKEMTRRPRLVEAVVEYRLPGSFRFPNGQKSVFRIFSVEKVQGKSYWVINATNSGANAFAIKSVLQGQSL